MRKTITAEITFDDRPPVKQKMSLVQTNRKTKPEILEYLKVQFPYAVFIMVYNGDEPYGKGSDTTEWRRK